MLSTYSGVFRSTARLSFGASVRLLSASLVRPAVQPQATDGQEAVRPYDAIPGPKGLPLLGTILDYREKYKLHKVIGQRFTEYGCIFKEKITPGLAELVFISDPVDMEKVFRAEGKYPRRFPLDIWIEARKEMKMPSGVFLAEGETWQRNRSPISKFTMVPRKVAEYHEGFNEVTADFLKQIRHQRDPESNLVTDVPSHLFKWSFESVALFVLGKRLGCLELGGVPPDCQEFIDAVQNFLLASHEILFSHELLLHRVWATKNWKTLLKSTDTIYSIAMNVFQEKIKEIKEEDARAIAEGDDHEAPDKVDFFTYLYHGSDLSLEEIAMNSLDLLGAGVDTTAYTLVWTLYCLATNPEAQEKLRREVQDVIGSDEIVTPAHVGKMSYLRGCVKETLRLNPIVVNNSRKLEEDIILSGYKVPAGTTILMPLLETGKSPEQFPEPDRYLPERWSKENTHQPNAFSSLPFGFGPRMCVGRRIAELELHIVLSHLMRNFRVEYRDDQPMEIAQKLFFIPERQVDLAFVDLQ